MVWILLLLLTGLFIGLVFLKKGRSRKKNEPPLDKGFLPWLGHALEFGKDAAKFLTRMKDKHGDIFTVLVAGHYVTMLLDPNTYDAVLYDTVSFDFSFYRNILMKRVFGLVLPGNIHTKEREQMEHYFQGCSLAKLSSSMSAHLQTLFLADQKGCSSEWRQEGLFDLCYSLLFRSGYLTVFERSTNAATVYQQFRKFDDLLPGLARSTLNRGQRSAATSYQENLRELLFPAPGGTLVGSSSSSWQQRYQNYLQEEGVNADTQRRALLLQLWVTQGNAGAAAFWLLGFLLTHPEAMEAVEAEIRSLALRHDSLQRLPLDKLETCSTPVFDSVLSETLRLSAAAIITRQVVRDRTLRMASGQEYHLRQGERICLFPFLSPQMDPQVHRDPQNFIYNRFLNDDMTQKKTFYKCGERLKYYNMPWGAGKTSCVGKQFASSTIKMFVLLVLTQLDLELCEPHARLPPANPSRYGLGMMQPQGDLQIRYRPKHKRH